FPPDFNIFLHRSTVVSERSFQVLIPLLWKSSSIFGPIPSIILRSSCLTFLPNTAFTLAASKGKTLPTESISLSNFNDFLHSANCPSKSAYFCLHFNTCVLSTSLITFVVEAADCFPNKYPNRAHIRPTIKGIIKHQFIKIIFLVY